MSATYRLASYVSELRYDHLSEVVVEKARRCMLDTIGCALAALESDEMRRFRRTLLALDSGGDGRVWGSGEACSVLTAALINGSLAHALDFDDSHNLSKTHPGAPIVPVVLAAAEIAQASSEQVLTGLVAGYEVTIRAAQALGAGPHRLKGWHATSTCGNLGAAAAASRVLGLTPDETASALGHAGTTASGLWAFAADGAMSKKLHPGHSAWAGLLSALLARTEFTGSRVILEAVDGGFFHTFAPEIPRENWEAVLLANIGETPGILGVAFKPYPCCRTAHNAIDAILDLRALGLRPDQVDEIEVRTYDVAVRQCGYHAPENAVRAMFSTPYLVAVALRDGWIEPRHFQPEQVADGSIDQLHRRVRLVFDQEMEDLFPGLWACKVTVRTHDGRLLSRRVEIARGDPKRALTTDEHNQKFLSCAAGVLPDKLVQQIMHQTLHLGRGGSVPLLMNALANTDESL